jgi:hypothetical protein
MKDPSEFILMSESDSGELYFELTACSEGHACAYAEELLKGQEVGTKVHVYKLHDTAQVHGVQWGKPKLHEPPPRKRKVFKHKRVPWKKDDNIATLRLMVERGDTLEQIARAFDCTEKAVYHARQKFL